MISWIHRLSSTRIFLSLWCLLVFIHEGDTWNRPLVALIAFASVLTAVLVPIERLAWFVSLVPITTYLLYWWPFNANHMDFILISNLFFLYNTWESRDFDLGELIEFLVVGLGVVYLFAALHKINSDFFIPEVSCANELMNRFLGRMGFGDTGRKEFLPWLAIITEVIVGLGVIFPKTRRWAVIGSLLFHFVLVWSNFVNFASIPLIIYFSFALNELAKKNHKATNLLKVYLFAYGLTQVIISLIGALEINFEGVNLSYYFSATLWTISATIFIWYWYSERFVWPRTRLSRPSYIFLLPIFVLGSQIYLGLGTANSFSMFSNLKTEGHAWNHLLIPRLAQRFKYQDEVYYFSSVSDTHWRTIRDIPQIGLGAPELEIERLYEIWGKDNTFPAVFFIQKEGDFSPRNGADLLPTYPQSYSWWEKKLMHFRAVQPSGPNQCRW